MQHRRPAVLTVLVLLLVVGGHPWSPAADAAAPEIVFDPPLTVVVRQTNGVPARGKLLRLTDTELSLRALNGMDVTLKLSKVRSIKSSDGEFEFRTNDETFSELAARIGDIAGATLKGDRPVPPAGNNSATGGKQQADADAADDDDDPDERRKRNRLKRAGQPRSTAKDAGPPPQAAADEADSPPQKSAEDADSQPGGVFGKAQTSPHNVAWTADERQGTKTPPVAAENSGAAREILFCSNCEQEFPAGFRSGSQCPGCGLVAVFEEEFSLDAATEPAASSRNPFAVPGGGGAPVQEQAAAPRSAPANQAPVVASEGGMGLADLPLIAKVGIFAGFIVAGWFLMQRR